MFSASASASALRPSHGHGHIIRQLSSGWELKEHGTDDHEPWLPVEHVPSEVHVELMRHGKIPDPFVDLNELAVRWVADRTWHYRTHFATPELVPVHEERGGAVEVDLVFEGLDTFATVTLNGHAVLQSDNMFVEHRVSVGHLLLKPGPDSDGPGAAHNRLEIVFEPAQRRGLELVEAHPEHDFIVHQTEVSRGPVRKVQSHWGWDWGPILLTCGPWKPVRLETYESRIEDIKVDYRVLDVGHGREPPVVDIGISARLVGPATRVDVSLSFQGRQVLEFVGHRDCESAPPASESAPWEFTSARLELEEPQLWWPRGYGAQNLYELRVRSLSTTGSESELAVLAEEGLTIGLRKVELVQEKDSHGQSFYFRVNEVDIFAGGSCWIPADSLLSRMTPERYRDWIAVLAEGNQTMVRVWGGGIYESDAFYDACDELGVLVWQDFMFACASYPTYPAYLASVETEARQNMGRLRHHPSLVVWCGNNEDYQLVERYGLEYRFDDDKDPQSWLRSSFPARYIYEHLLPAIARDESPGSIYHPGSPWGDGNSTTLQVDATVGDIHQWDVWHGAMKPYQTLAGMGGRFVSEFGMEAYPHVETIRRFATRPDEQFPGSTTMDFHNKAVGHERRLLAYLGDNFRLRHGLAAFAHLTQVMQADAVSWAYKSWRRGWGTPGSRRCGGVLVWQLNDCWPAVSWAIVDYFMVKKPAYYAVKRAMAPISVGVARSKFHDWTTHPADNKLWRRDTGHVDPTRALTDITFDVWAASSSIMSSLSQARLAVRFISIKTGQDVRAPMERRVAIQPNSCTEVFVDCQCGVDSAHSVADPFVIHASLEAGDELSSIVVSDTSWPDPIKYLDFGDRGVRVQHITENLVEVSATKPVKGFVFAEKQGVRLSDNGFDVMPGEKPRKVTIERDIMDDSDSSSDSDFKLDWTFVGQN
ncbi:glycoside hydrolase family 2 protein [Podospora appendiculata]|uniref:Beta-mannosidase B n=1 Tax=Podospora appendiculata TaxID=314037 RepID=A0AAE0X0F5_9PEZI|nr:glycoside hydrolase family 2 protein [Podospora appendiculata]